MPESYTDRAIHPLSEDEVKQVLAYEIGDAIGGTGDGTEQAENRRQAHRYYAGKKFGNEIEGRSQFVITDVRDTIEWIMPTLMRMLVPNSERAVRMKPKRPGSEAKKQAKIATKGVNHVLMVENDGFSLLQDWFKTCLIERNGFTKTYYEEVLEPEKATYRGLDEIEVQILEEDGGLVLLDIEISPEMVKGELVNFYDVTVQNRKVRGSIKVEGVPPEEMLIARRALKLNDKTSFSGHHKKTTVGELLAMGFDRETVLNAPRDDTPEFSLARQERQADDGTWITGDERIDAASTELWVIEAYIRIDEDGDGYSELRKITVVGEDAQTLLGDEEINHNPFSSITPCPMPFRFEGQSIYDLIGELQKMRSVLLRAMMDNLFLANNPRTEVVEGQVNVDDLLTSRPGNIVRVRSPGMMREVSTEAFSPMALGMMELLQSTKENATGITAYNQGLDAESLNQTASGLNQIMVAAAARVELIARIIAKTGFKDLAQKIYQTMKESPMAAFEVQLGEDEWLSVDPNAFTEDLDVEIVVGLGVGAAQERVQNIQMIMDLQAQVVDRGYGDYLVTAQNIFNSTEELVDAIDMTLPNQFFTDPSTKEQPPPKKADAVIVQELRAEIDKAKIEVDTIKTEIDANKESALVSHRADDLAQQRVLEEKRIESDAATRIEVARINAEVMLDVARLNAETQKATAATAAASKSNGATAPA